MRTKIKHAFAVRPKAGAESDEIQDFLGRTAEILPSIPGVENFAIYRQINPDTGFDYLVSMEFACEKAYREYNRHPLHENYVADVWMKIAGEIMVFDLEEIKIATSLE